jgi:hypothetical protein
MPTKPIERLLFAQGRLCFFCQQPLEQADASVEHLVATANGGRNSDENTVACCKALNSLLGRKSLKEKLQVILNQKGAFKCPNGAGKRRTVAELPVGALERVIAYLQKSGTAKPGAVRTLMSSINNLFQKSLSTPQVTMLVDMLKSRSIIIVNGTKVAYPEDGGSRARLPE